MSWCFAGKGGLHARRKLIKLSEISILGYVNKTNNKCGDACMVKKPQSKQTPDHTVGRSWIFDARKFCNAFENLCTWHSSTRNNRRLLEFRVSCVRVPNWNKSQFHLLCSNIYIYDDTDRNGSNNVCRDTASSSGGLSNFKTVVGGWIFSRIRSQSLTFFCSTLKINFVFGGEAAAVTVLWAGVDSNLNNTGAISQVKFKQNTWYHAPLGQLNIHPSDEKPANKEFWSWISHMHKWINIGSNAKHNLDQIIIMACLIWNHQKWYITWYIGEAHRISRIYS